MGYNKILSLVLMSCFVSAATALLNDSPFDVWAYQGAYWQDIGIPSNWNKTGVSNIQAKGDFLWATTLIHDQKQSAPVAFYDGQHWHKTNFTTSATHKGKLMLAPMFPDDANSRSAISIHYDDKGQLITSVTGNGYEWKSYTQSIAAPDKTIALPIPQNVICTAGLCYLFQNKAYIKRNSSGKIEAVHFDKSQGYRLWLTHKHKWSALHELNSNVMPYFDLNHLLLKPDHSPSNGHAWIHGPHHELITLVAATSTPNTAATTPFDIYILIFENGKIKSLQKMQGAQNPLQPYLISVIQSEGKAANYQLGLTPNGVLATSVVESHVSGQTTTNIFKNQKLYFKKEMLTSEPAFRISANNIYILEYGAGGVLDTQLDKAKLLRYPFAASNRGIITPVTNKGNIWFIDNEDTYVKPTFYQYDPTHRTFSPQKINWSPEPFKENTAFDFFSASRFGSVFAGDAFAGVIHNHQGDYLFAAITPQNIWILSPILHNLPQHHRRNSHSILLYNDHQYVWFGPKVT